MSFKGKKVLVTGASGFIGSHLTEKLVSLGADVRAMTHYRSEPGYHNLEFVDKEILAELEIVRGNIEDPFFVSQSVKGCDLVFHLAALIAIPYSYVAPASYVGANISGTLNILEACKTLGVEKLVHTSTSECYGTAIYTPIDEKHPLQGQSPYSASKIAADKLAESYFCSFELPVVTIRPFNTFGPRQSTRAIIPTIISQVIERRKTILLGSLSPVRDFTFVEDTAMGFIRGALSPNVEGQTINLGVGKGITIGELVDRISNIVGHSINVELDDTRIRPGNSEVFELISDNRKAQKNLDWCPQTTLDDGLKKTIEFMTANRHLYKSKKYEV